MDIERLITDTPGLITMLLARNDLLAPFDHRPRLNASLPVAFLLVLFSSHPLLFANDIDVIPSQPVNQSQAGQPEWPRRLRVQNLPNAIQFHPQVFSGGLPEGDAAFAELHALGVKTIISVDGALPDIQRAKRYGLCYVHLPHGYSGIPDSRAKELAKAVTALPGPIYIHCHHGKHRSPAAAVVACKLAGIDLKLSPTELLQFAGTSSHYRGLYDSALAARTLAPELLSQLPDNFPEVAKLPPLAEAMVAVEHTFGRLSLLCSADWQAPPQHPDLDPAHEALLLREHFAEMLRLPAPSQPAPAQPEAFVQLLRSSSIASEKLEQALRSKPMDRVAASELFAKISMDCTSCHNRFRDLPLPQAK